MKTKHFSIFSSLVALVLSFGFSAVALAQQNTLASDTIDFRNTPNQYAYLRNFDTLATGQSQCHTIFLKNSSGGTMILNSVKLASNQGGGFTLKPIPALPTVLLASEIVSIADLCYSPSATNDSNDYFSITVAYTIGSKSGMIGGYGFGYRIGDTLLKKPCVTATISGDLFGPIIMDGDVSQTVTLTSNRHTDVIIKRDAQREAGYDNSVFQISGITFPYTLAPLEVKTFTITYSPRSNAGVVVYRSVGKLSWIATFGGSQCSEADISLPGVAIPPTDPTKPTDLTAGSTDVLAMISDNSVTTQTFNFKNNGATNLKITGVSLKYGKSFSITNITPSNTLPFTLAPGASMTVTVSMTTVTNGVYYDEVIITAEQGFMSMNFELQGLRTGSLGVHDATPQGSHLRVYPNPTQGEISMSLPGIRNAKIEVFDVLGKVITRATASEMWNWRSTEPAGTYIVHVSGTDPSGKTFQSYDRFVIAK